MAKRILLRLITEEDGSSAMEYGLIASLISVGAIAGYVALSGSASAVWTYASTAITSALE